jgi:hypothetical protein
MREMGVCTYLKYSGDVCAKRCYGDICGEHASRGVLTPCTICGRSTASRFGFCKTPGPCAISQHDAGVRAYRAAKILKKREAAVVMSATVYKKWVIPVRPAVRTNPEVELDAFADELLDALGVEAA